MKIATSGTLEGITKIINQYWYSDKYSVDPETLEILHPKLSVPGYRVRLHKGKFIFESLT